MKILKTALIAFGVIIAIALIVPLFTQKEYSVKRDIIINKPKSEVYDYVKYLKNQDNFSVWARRDPNMKKEYRGEDAKVGFVSAWDSQSDEVGKGEQEIKAIKEGEKIDYELRFLKPFEATEHAYFAFEEAGENATKVTWGFDGKMDYPMNAMLLLMDMEAMLGKDFEDGLATLKTILEKQ